MIVLRRQALPPADVRIHLVDVDAGAPLEALIATATGEERDRAARYRSPDDRRRYLARRLHLRERVGERLGRRPDGVRFSYGPHGKPHLADAALGVSVAHSGGLALIVLGGGLEVGCDIEAVDLAFCWRQVGRADVLSTAEAQALEGADPAAARRGFFELWTLKEAALKCLGLGLSIAASSVLVEGYGAAEPERNGRAGTTLPACSIATAPAFAAAVVWTGRPTRTG